MSSARVTAGWIWRDEDQTVVLRDGAVAGSARSTPQTGIVGT